MSVPDIVRHGSPQVIFEDYLVVGFNYRMTDIQAAVGRKQLERLPELVSRRRALAARYGELLGNFEGLRLPAEPDWARSNWQSYCVGCRTVSTSAPSCKACSITVSRLDAALCARTASAVPNGKQRRDLQQSELAQDNSILLPIYAQMDEHDQSRVADALRAQL